MSLTYTVPASVIQLLIFVQICILIASFNMLVNHFSTVYHVRAQCRKCVFCSGTPLMFSGFPRSVSRGELPEAQLTLEKKQRLQVENN